MENEQEHFDQEHFHIPPNMLFGSFLLIAGAYMFIVIVLTMMDAGFVFAFLPETAELLVGDQDVFKQELEANADKMYPPEYRWTLLALNGAVCYLTGWVVARMARFGKFPHCVFLAVLLFVHFFQAAIGSPPDLQLMKVLFMGSSPIAILIGASQSLGGGRGNAVAETSSDNVQSD